MESLRQKTIYRCKCSNCGRRWKAEKKPTKCRCGARFQRRKINLGTKMLRLFFGLEEDRPKRKVKRAVYA
jgi:hypothetical protein